MFTNPITEKQKQHTPTFNKSTVKKQLMLEKIGKYLANMKPKKYGNQLEDVFNEMRL